ncbi:hypothetical protein BST61_g2181 [Cercospora zeina]
MVRRDEWTYGEDFYLNIHEPPRQSSRQDPDEALSSSSPRKLMGNAPGSTRLKNEISHETSLLFILVHRVLRSTKSSRRWLCWLLETRPRTSPSGYGGRSGS